MRADLLRAVFTSAHKLGYWQESDNLASR